MSRLLVGVVRVYQMTLSPLIVAVAGPCCRFHPSCSQYAIEALRKHGVLKGSWLSAWRIMRCQPFCEGGLDPVP